jgi:hypothetical protein
MTTASVLLFAALSTSAPLQPGGPTHKDVQAAREKAIDYLKKQQNPQGTWEGTALSFAADMEGGMTALAALALLEAGVPANDPAVAKALDYLAKLPPRKTKVVSLQIRALAKADPRKYAIPIQAGAGWLAGSAIRQDGRLGGWSYPTLSTVDGSNTHFAVVGLHAAVQAGAKIDPRLWGDIQDLYARTRKDGGWVYHPAADTRPTRSMTAAALVGLSLAAKHRKDADAGKDAFDKGMTSFLTDELTGTKSEGYLLMTTAELGRAIGTRTFEAGKKEIAWYKEGVAKLIKGQQADGSFSLNSRGIDGAGVLTTAFGLYFLGPPEKK